MEICIIFFGCTKVVQDCRNQRARGLSAPKHFFNEGIFQVFNFANMEAEDRVDPMSRVFPRMTKCNFHKYGGSGTIEVIDALCVLSMNIINEKIYIFLWCWFILVALITGINIVVRLVQFFMPDVRQR